ncbi:substrate-binding domain-containing protein [Steroidobacter sp.]|uniref:substrate-binding domain-containing protein n=1 Tax=Steroidobacter sp. TaxID=1978227 RepID=UPI001A44BF6F|nr:substrate-binding domain-containing protein [Steroidobacter sp.]MBL8270045.1 substrate-binding domain-containing protein [Steroidobacter sp.]
MARSSLVVSRRSSNRLRLSAAISICMGLAGVALSAGSAAVADQSESILRVCADPDNLPLSNRRGEGYENKIAEELARDLGRRVEYTFFPQRMGFVRNTLKQRDAATKEFKCDVIIGVPKGYELTATTRPYMHSTYALVFAEHDGWKDVQTADDLLKLPREQLAKLHIGVFGRSPGADWLLRNNLLEQAVMYAPQSGDPAENPAHTIENDLASGKIDAAIVWGPIAGFLVQRRNAAPAWQSVPFLPDPAIKFDYEIAMGVRFGEKEWQSQLDAWIGAHQTRIDQILSSYRVPLLDASGKVKQARRENGS